MVAYTSGEIVLATTEIELADTIELVRIPQGVRILGGWMTASNMDVNACPVLAFDVGDSDDPDGFLDGTTVGGLVDGGTEYFGQIAGLPGNVAVPAYMRDGFTTSAETIMIATVAAAAGTAAAGSINVVFFGMSSNHPLT